MELLKLKTTPIEQTNCKLNQFIIFIIYKQINVSKNHFNIIIHINIGVNSESTVRHFDLISLDIYPYYNVISTLILMFQYKLLVNGKLLLLKVNKMSIQVKKIDLSFKIIRNIKFDDLVS